jgi:small conductance mechanosensitive channel
MNPGALDETPSTGPARERSVSSPSPRHVAYAVALLVGLVVVGFFVYREALIAHLVPVSSALWVRLGITFAVGVAAIVAIERLLVSVLPRHFSMRRASLTISFYRLASYTILALALLLTVGVSSLALLAGGTFAGLVLGLAGQTVLSNVIAGIMLLFVRPLEPGERVTLSTWQYGFIAPGYPPKFFSQDTLIPGFTGVVQEVGFAYTTLLLDEGTRLRMPNSIIVQAAVLSHELSERWVRIRYELPPTIDPAAIIAQLQTKLPENNWVVRPELLKIALTSVTLTSSVIQVDAMCRGNLEDPPRSALLLEIRSIVNAAGKGTQPAVPPASPPAATAPAIVPRTTGEGSTPGPFV